MDRNRDLFDSWESYQKTCRELSRAMASRTGAQVRLAKKTSNLFRTRTEAAAQKLDVRRLHRVIEIDSERRIAEVEGMTTFEDFADATLMQGLRPPVVPQLKTITVGGAVSGLGIEASSFRHGLVHETVEEMEILCGDGTIRVCRPDNENADLFHAIPNSYGTLGYILRLRMKLLPAESICQAHPPTLLRSHTIPVCDGSGLRTESACAGLRRGSRLHTRRLRAHHGTTHP